MKRTLIPTLTLGAAISSTFADPTLTSWYTDNATQYARVYETKAAQTVVTTWSQGQGVQATPVYADINKVSYSNDWVYVLTSGLSSHIMGPWYFDDDKTQVFANFPSNQNRFYRVPRSPVEDTVGTKTKTSAGINGIYVNGVAMFDMTDTFSYDTSTGFDATTGDQNDPNGPAISTSVTVIGDSIWNRDAFINEAVTFDPTNTHQAGSNYHYHANPVGIRHQLGDSVDYAPTTNSYTENFNGNHSPILGWAADGFPVYGPYGYSDPTDANSSVRRMISGFQRRDGTNGTTDLAATGRTTLPAWAAALQGRSSTLVASQYGPEVDAQINWDVYELAFDHAELGRYLEDYDYKGSHSVLTLYENAANDGPFDEALHFDLNLNNGRFCVTPDYPEGIFAYFITIESDGTPAYPYVMGREFYGNVTGGAVTSISETVTEHFSVTSTFQESPESITISGSDVTIQWNALEGATYTIESSLELSEWDSESTTATPTGNDLIYTDTSITNSEDRMFYRISRTGLSTADALDGAGSGTGGPGGGGPGGPPRM